MTLAPTARSVLGVVLVIGVELMLWRSVLHDFDAPPRDGYLVLVNGRFVSVALGFAALLAVLVVGGVLEWVRGPDRTRWRALSVALAVAVAAALLSGGAVTDALARSRGLVRCEALDELRRGNVRKNDVTVRAYVLLQATPGEATQRCQF